MATENNDLIEKNAMAWVSIWATIFFFRRQNKAVDSTIDDSGGEVEDIEVIEFESSPPSNFIPT